MPDRNQQLITFFCGLPSTGKTSIARGLLPLLKPHYPGIRHVDIDDEFRLPFMGMPHPHPEESQEIEHKDVAQMSEAWNMLFFWMERALTRSWPYIFTATMSSKKWGQDRLWALRDKFPQATFRVISCFVDVPPDSDVEREIISERIEKRRREGYTGATNSYERWVVLRNRYEPIVVPHLRVDTARPPDQLPYEIGQAIAYIVKPQPHDQPNQSLIDHHMTP